MPAKKMPAPTASAYSGALMAPPPSAKPEPPPDISEFSLTSTDKLNLSRMVQESAAWAAQEKEAKAARKPLTDGIKKILGAYQLGRVIVSGLWVNYFNSPRTSISKDRLQTVLMNEGMQPSRIQAIIQAASTTTDSYTLRITVPGEAEEREY